MKTNIYIFPYDERGNLSVDTTRTQLIEFLIGHELLNAFEANDNPTNGLQLVRLNVGNSVVIAMRRLNDVKVTIKTYNNKPI